LRNSTPCCKSIATGLSSPLSICVPCSVMVLNESLFASSDSRRNRLEAVTFESTSCLTRIDQFCFAYCSLSYAELLRLIESVEGSAFFGTPIRAVVSQTPLFRQEGGFLVSCADYRLVRRKSAALDWDTDQPFWRVLLCKVDDRDFICKISGSDVARGISSVLLQGDRFFKSRSIKLGMVCAYIYQLLWHSETCNSGNFEYASLITRIS
jgi:hypothetical protein